MKKFKQNGAILIAHKPKGITLIALIITIIVLLILAGVTISMLTGENSILRNAKTSSEKYSEESAREKLEVKLAEMQTEKILKKEEYNQDDYLTQELINEGFGVSGNVVIVDEWQFLIDRSVPKIVASLGKGVKNEQIEIELSQEVSEDYTKSTITIKVTATEEIKSILLNGEEVKDLIQEDGTITKEVTENGTYSVIAKNTNDNYNMKSITVTEITEDMDIWNKEDLVAFSEKVNSGRTFEGRTVRVLSDININEGKYTIGEGGVVTFEPDAEQWIPIANHGEDNILTFKGTFEGNNHTIKGLYIENDKTHQGLFGYNEGIIKDLTIEEGYINGTATTATINESLSATIYFTSTGSANIGAIAGTNRGGQILNCINKISIEGNTLLGGIAGYNAYIEGKTSIIENCTNEGTIAGVGNVNSSSIAGIVGTNQGEVKNNINKGKIIIKNTTTITFLSTIGGIVGYNFHIITNCTNQGEIINSGNSTYNHANGATGGLFAGGITGVNIGEVKNSINMGKISNPNSNSKTSNYLAGVIGTNGAGGIINKCENQGEVTNTGTGNVVNTGGIAGGYTGQIINCVNKGTITNNGTIISTVPLRTGGIIGYVEDASVLNCYNLGEVKSSGTGASDVGGITGCAYNSGKIHLCYNTGSVSNTATGTKRTGAITGYNNISITNCYYKTGTASAGIGGGTNTGTTAMSDADMKLETFVNTLNSLRQTGYLEWVKTDTYPTFKTQ